jgi:hypothetical protein
MFTIIAEFLLKFHVITRYRTHYCKLSPSTPRQLTFIARTDSNANTFAKCEQWQIRIVVFAVALMLARASAWFLVVKNMTAGMVPLCVATLALLTVIDIDWGVALCSIAAIATLVALVGFVQNPFAREKLVWSLYTLLFVFFCVLLRLRTIRR